MKPIFNFVTLFSIIFFAGSFVGIAQVDQDTVAESDLEIVSYLSASASYVSNGVDQKRMSSSETSSTIADLTFYHKSGAFIGVMPSFYKEENDLDLTLGYTKYFDSGFDISANYQYHYTTLDDSLFSGIDYLHSFRTSLGYFAKNLFLYTDAYSMHGKSHNYFIEPGLGLYFDIEGVFTTNDYITIFPMASVTFGTDFYIYESFSFYQYYWASKYMTSQGYKIENVSYQSIDFILPVSYTIQEFTFSATFLFSSPGSKYRTYGWENQSGLLFSLFYMLNF